MEDVCRSYTDYQSLKVNKGHAYVNFSSLEGATTAMEFLKKVKFYGQCPIVKLHDKDSIQASPTPPQAQAYTFSPSFTHPSAHSPLPSALPISPDARIPLPTQTHIPLPTQTHIPLPTQTHIPPLACVFPRVPLSAPHSYAFPFPVYHLPQAQYSHNRKSTTQSSTEVSSTIKVTFGSSGITGEVLEGYFRQFGKVLKTPAIISGNPDYAYVNFESSKEAKAACTSNKVHLNGVQVNIKLSNKQLSVENGSKVVTYEEDALVNLITISKFPELEIQLSNVSAKPLNDGRGILISGDNDKVEMAESIVRLHMQLLQSQIITESINLHCQFIPLLKDPQVFQNIEQENGVEFSIKLPNGSTKSMVTFSSTIASAMSSSYPLTIESISDYLTISHTGVVSWKFIDDDKKFTLMSATDSAEIEKLYQQHLLQSPGLIHHSLIPPSYSIGKWRYTYDFDDMIQCNTTTQKEREIKRIPALDSLSLCLSCRGLKESVQVSIASLRKKLEGMVKMKTFGSFCTECIIELAQSFCVKVESSFPNILLFGDGDYLTKVFLVLAEKRASLQSVPLSSSSSFPPEWEPQTKNTELKPVKVSSLEWTKVVSAIKKTMVDANILKIERIQNKFLYEKYDLCKKRMHEKNNGLVNEKWLFHGSSSVSPEKIYESEHGFDFRHSGSSSLWGKGAYFAVNASYSGRRYAYRSPLGYQQIFIAFVLTGDSIRMASDPTLVTPPSKDDGSGDYDSVNGMTSSSRIYIVYDHDKCYPAYLITLY
ncbi:PREDICTED: uncharacterized protein LOC105313855 [Amphimedon queenslandica]|uniref:Poly [ADP-ribose] polymerase n=1 Tax=Amphimedon queenslandica TaxID=400682 RepID=A0A1X7U6Z5_AMPQE|nr:PREDICTED: uncharacterized protein LOC105313855 [Amphimedon queenslandica]|eukprot:XP_019855862.1 PREDICTED: uncharacterized protein LOC105313855 [Amphimedon queenslandica]